MFWYFIYGTVGQIRFHEDVWLRIRIRITNHHTTVQDGITIFFARNWEAYKVIDLSIVFRDIHTATCLCDCDEKIRLFLCFSLRFDYVGGNNKSGIRSGSGRKITMRSDCREPAISFHSHHVSLVQGTTRLLPVTRDLGSKPLGGDLCETGILLLAMSRYIGDPDVIDHFCGLVWGGLRPEPSLGPHADNVIISLDLTQLFCPGFMLAAGPPSSFTTDGVGCWGGGSPVENLKSHFILTMSHWSSGLPVCFPSQGTQVQNPLLCETRILLLASSRYMTLFWNCPLQECTGHVPVYCRISLKKFFFFHCMTPTTKYKYVADFC